MARLRGILARGGSLCHSRSSSSSSSSSSFYSSFSRREGLEKSVGFWGHTSKNETAWFLCRHLKLYGGEKEVNGTDKVGAPGTVDPWSSVGLGADFRYGMIYGRSRDGKKEVNGTDHEVIAPFSTSQGIAERRFCVALGSNLYAFGGSGEQRPKFEYFNLHSPKAGWIKGPEMCYGERCMPRPLVLDGKIYVIGGIFGDESDNYAEKFGLAEVYDPNSETWEALPQGPPPQPSLSRLDSPNMYCAALEYSKKILVGFYNSNVCYTYDVMKKSWDELPDGPDTTSIILSSDSVSRPIVEGQSLYWLTHPRKILSYNLEEKKWLSCHIHPSRADQDELMENLESLSFLPSFFRRSDRQFCLVWSDDDPLDLAYKRIHCAMLWVFTNRGYQFGDVLIPGIIGAKLISCETKRVDRHTSFMEAIVLNGRFGFESKLADESAPRQMIGQTDEG